MSFPGTPSRTTYVSSTTNATSWAAFSNVSVAAGSLAIFILSSDGNPTLSVSGGDTDWTMLGQASQGTSVTMAIWVWRNDTAGAVDKSFTLSSSASEQYSGILLVIPRSAANKQLHWDVDVSNGSSANSDPPLLTPLGGTQDYLWIAGRSGDSTVNATAAPSGFSDLTTADAGGTAGASTATAERQFNGSTLDPGAFTSLTEQWLACTLPVWETDTGVTLAVDGGTFALTGQAAGLQRGLRLAAASVGFTANGQAATLTRSRRFVAAGGSQSLSGQVAGLFAARCVVAGAGAVAPGGQAAGIRAGRRLLAGAGPMAHAGQAAALRFGYRLPANAASLALTGQAAGPKASRRLGSAPGTATVAAQAAALRSARSLGAVHATFGISGSADFISAGSLIAAPGSVTLTGGAAALARGYRLPGASGGFAATVPAAAWVRQLVLPAEPGSVALAGIEAALSLSSGIVRAFAPASRRFAASPSPAFGSGGRNSFRAPRDGAGRTE